MLKSYRLIAKTNKFSKYINTSVGDLYKEGTMLCKLAYLGDLDQMKHYIENEVNIYNSRNIMSTHLMPIIEHHYISLQQKENLIL